MVNRVSLDCRNGPRVRVSARRLAAGSSFLDDRGFGRKVDGAAVRIALFP
jgi:hypothetical protein